MRKLSRLFATAALPLLLICPAPAAFNPAIVGADAQWMVFVDLQELRGTTLGKDLIDMGQKHLAPDFANAPVRVDVQKILGLINTITAYGASFSTDPKTMDGTLVIEGTADLRKIAEGLVAQASLLAKPKDVAEVTDLPFEAYLLGGEVVVGFPREPIVLISKSKAQLLKAHTVYRGTAPSLAKAAASPLRTMIKPTGRPYLVAGSVVPNEKQFKAEGPQARIFQLASSGSLSLSEVDQRTVGHAELIAASDDAGRKLLKIVEGMAAMLSLAETNDRQLTEFLQSAVVQQNGRSVSLDLSYSSTRLAAMVRALQQQPAAKSGPPAAAQIPGKILAQWKLDQAPAGSVAGAATLAERKIEHVRLTTGSTLTIGGRRETPGAGMTGMFDAIEISPMDRSAPPLRFEAENMRLVRYRAMNAPFASGRRLIVLRGAFGSAQFEFPGADGDYLVNVRYVEEPDAKTTLTVGLKEPAPPPLAPEAK